MLCEGEGKSNGRLDVCVERGRQTTMSKKKQGAINKTNEKRCCSGFSFWVFGLIFFLNERTNEWKVGN